ncbi:MAG: TonB-dependent receptor [Bacteroidetes bacterium]|nr:TonB-dependent receptor [Bacteroidota bacterium]MDA0942968.1 TonB-dependent receptor [Bacteroidota bacterium]MDA1111660.1 TonB-dependent receptor [Bacteroidota bacterium]
MRRISLVALCFSLLPSDGFAQLDSNQHVEYLQEINLVGKGNHRDHNFLPEIVGTQIQAGKKNCLIVVDKVNAVVANNSMRQILAKVPGIHIWESDGSGIQIGIAHRGLSPNRSWEFNVRQNGMDIAADPYGYPEAYYNPQMQSVQRIQIIKGAGALQYGPQFGGLINYVVKDGSDIHKPLAIESEQTLGSFGLNNQYIALGGQKGQIHYYAFYDARRGDGFRKNSPYNTQTAMASINWSPSTRWKMGVEVMQFDMLSQQPGGLLDSLLYIDPRESLRARNWFSTTWKTGQWKTTYTFNKNTQIQSSVFGMDAYRKSVGFMSPITVPDPGTDAAREAATDRYRNYGSEWTLLHRYSLGGKTQSLSAGIRYFHGQTDRLQKGVIASGSDPNFDPIDPYPVQLTFLTQNKAAFVQQLFKISPRLSLIPGLRWEQIQSTATGQTGWLSNGEPKAIGQSEQNRQFVLGAISAEYHLNHSTEVYLNYSQAYRPVLFSDMINNPGAVLVDPNIQDAKGTNADLGIRSNFSSFLQFDFSLFSLQYNNRIGSISQLDSQGNVYTFKTNVGNSQSTGVEGMVQFDPLEALKPKSALKMPLFVSYAYTQALYGDYRYTVKTGSEIQERNLSGNQVENAPKHLLRSGLQTEWEAASDRIKNLQMGLQYSYVSSVFADANNTQEAATNAQNGLIPSYGIWDWNAQIQFQNGSYIKASINNLSNEIYFTRRAGGYPGPGAMPADGRSLLISIGVEL